MPGFAGSGNGLTGSFVMADGVSHAFSTELASGPGALYRTDETMADGMDAEGGWVVLNSGDVPFSDSRWVIAGFVDGGDYELCQSQPVLAQSAPLDLMTQMQPAKPASRKPASCHA